MQVFMYWTPQNTNDFTVTLTPNPGYSIFFICIWKAQSALLEIHHFAIKFIDSIESCLDAKVKDYRRRWYNRQNVEKTEWIYLFTKRERLSTAE